MSPLDAVMMTIMVFLCIVMLYYISRLIREDPGFWGAALDKETWLKMGTSGKRFNQRKILRCYASRGRKGKKRKQ